MIPCLNCIRAEEGHGETSVILFKDKNVNKRGSIGQTSEVQSEFKLIGTD